MEYTAGKYLMLVELMPGKYKEDFVFSFNCSVWMNTLFHTVDCMLHMCACG